VSWVTFSSGHLGCSRNTANAVLLLQRLHCRWKNRANRQSLRCILPFRAALTLRHNSTNSERWERVRPNIFWKTAHLYMTFIGVISTARMHTVHGAWTRVVNSGDYINYSYTFKLSVSIDEPFRLPSSAKMWNALPGNVVSASSIESFRHQLNTFLGSSDRSADSTSAHLQMVFITQANYKKSMIYWFIRMLICCKRREVKISLVQYEQTVTVVTLCFEANNG